MENWEQPADHSEGKPMGDTRYLAKRRLAVESLMRCPLCGAVNASSNDECFVCTWAGAFEHEPEMIEEGLADLLDRCPELEDVILENDSPSKSRAVRVRAFLKRLFWPTES